MVDVLKREDALLDKISNLIRQREECKALMDLYMEGGLLMPPVASHLWEVLNGLITEGGVGEDHSPAPSESADRHG